MADRIERVLALDIDAGMVRGIVLAHGPQAVAGGYAQLGYGADQPASVVAARISAALDVKAMLPVVVTTGASFDSRMVDEIVAAVAAGGFDPIDVVPRDESMQRSNPTGGIPDKLVDADIASGLLTSHAGLTLADLAPVVGAGLGKLAMGASLEAPVEPVEVWHPEVAPESADDDDPFTAGATIAGAAAATAAAAGVASAFDDDNTTTATGTVDDVTTPSTEQTGEIANDDDVTVSSAAGASAAIAAAVAAEKAAATEAPGPNVVTAQAADPAKPANAASSPEQQRRRGAGPLVAVAVGLLAALGLGAFVFFTRGGDDVATEAQPESVPATEVLEVTVEPEPTLEAEPTPEPIAEPTSVVEPTTEPEPTAAVEPTSTVEPTPDPLAGLPPLSSLPERGAIFRPPTLFLEGPVQTQAQADELFERAVAVVGPDNVVNNYVVRPDAPAALDGNVRVEQAVLFRIASATISEEFIPTLELGVAVMVLNPDVQMVVEGHTDSVGDETLNRRLSERRAEAVVDYLIERGVEPERLEAVGFGESNPVASNDTAEGRQVNRRIEVNLLDLLSGD